MKNEKVMERLLDSYRTSFDIQRPWEMSGLRYDAYGAFRVTSSKYVLTKKAELWRAQCFEHVFFRLTEELRPELLEEFRGNLQDYMEPELVRQGEKYPPKDHMYTFLTGVFLCEKAISPQMQREIRGFRFSRNYLFTIRGYCDARVVAVDVPNQKLYGNPASREIQKGYKKMKHLFI